MSEMTSPQEQAPLSREEISSRLAKLAIFRLHGRAAPALSDVFSELGELAGSSRYARLTMQSAQAFATREEYYKAHLQNGRSIQRAEHWIESITDSLPNHQLFLDPSRGSFEPRSLPEGYAIAFRLRPDSVAPYRRMLDKVGSIAPPGKIAPIGSKDPSRFVARFDLPNASIEQRTEVEVRLLAALHRLMDVQPDVLALGNISLAKEEARLPVAAPER